MRMNEPGTLTFGGKVISDLPGIKIFAVSIDNAPARVYEKPDIPERGTTLLDEGYYKNVEQIYSFVIENDVESYTDSAIEKLRSYLLGYPGYYRLEDSWHTGEVYNAYLPDGLNITVSADRKMAKGELRFERMPQRYYKNGLTPEPVTNDLAVEQVSYVMPSMPNISIINSTGSTVSGTFVIGEAVNGNPSNIIILHTITVTQLAANGRINIDCADGTIKNLSGESAANKVSLSNGLPVLSSQDKSTTFVYYTTGDLTGYITPRWWIL